MTEHRTWNSATPCVWEGEATTIGAVVRMYRDKAPAYVNLIPRAIANGSVSNHSELMSYDLACRARRKKGGQAAAKHKPCHFKVRREKA